MGTITARKRKDGTVGYLAQIVIKRKSKVVHREALTFDRRQAANAWLKRRETELAVPGALDHRDDPPPARCHRPVRRRRPHELEKPKARY
jgi:hypothetical protein